MYAFDTRERAKAGHRSREWTAVADSELEVVGDVARCLRLIREGRAPAVWRGDASSQAARSREAEPRQEK